ncbi:hypothetical protein ACWXVO_00930 [Mycoplasma sp. 1890]
MKKNKWIKIITIVPFLSTVLLSTSCIIHKNEDNEQHEDIIKPGGIYKAEYSHNPLLYSKLRNKDKGEVIKRPFRKITFKTENKYQELIDFVNENKVKNYYMLAINVKLENNDTTNKKGYEKEFKIWLTKAKEITFLYFPHSVKLLIPDQFNNTSDYFASPLKKNEEFIIPISNVRTINDEMKFRNPLYFDTWQPGEGKWSLLRILRKNKIKFSADKTLDVIDGFTIWVNHYHEEAEASVVFERYYPKMDNKSDDEYIKEYEIDVKKITHKNKLFTLDY